MLKPVLGSAVLYVKDLARMRAFYEAAFRMATVDEADDFCVLESESLSLSLVAVPDHIAGTIVISDPPARREEAPVKLGFPVESIVAVRAVAPALGGLVDPEPAEWTFRRAVHCDGVDPEGNVIQLVQPVITGEPRTD
jgi:predicted enzyme related to lactoylglutathione lyase